MNTAGADGPPVRPVCPILVTVTWTVTVTLPPAPDHDLDRDPASFAQLAAEPLQNE